MHVRNEKIAGRIGAIIPSMDEINVRIADARRAQSLSIARMVSAYFGALERYARNRPRRFD